MTKDSPQTAQPSFPTSCSGFFDECREACPFHVLTSMGAGWQHDCAHCENLRNLPVDQTPCDPRICPIFTSNDDDGDEENDRYEHEVNGSWTPQNTELTGPAPAKERNDEH